MIYVIIPTDIDDEESALSEAYKALEMSVYTTDQLLEYERYAWKEEEIQTRIDDAIKQSKEEGLAEGEKIGIEKGEKIGIEKGKTEGEKIGIEKGKAEGEKKAKIETARKMFLKGFSVEDISEFTGLSIEEIESIMNI